MTGTKEDLIIYRLERAKETLDDAEILANNNKWNSTINRLYYAVIALLIKENVNPGTHDGVKTKFSEIYIKTNRIDRKFGKVYSQLFTWRQKGDYDDLFDFDEEKVKPYFKPVKELITIVEDLLIK